MPIRPKDDRSVTTETQGHFTAGITVRRASSTTPYAFYACV